MNDAHAWRAKAACDGHDPDLWHPKGDQQAKNYPIARRICQGCPVRDECLEFALAFDALEGEGGGLGMYGGLTGGERMNLLDQRRKGQDVVPVGLRCAECEAPLPEVDESRKAPRARSYCPTGGCRQRASKRRVAERQRQLDNEARLAAFEAAHGLARSLQGVAS